jgi:hypothetical protein
MPWRASGAQPKARQLHGMRKARETFAPSAMGTLAPLPRMLRTAADSSRALQCTLPAEHRARNLDTEWAPCAVQRLCAQEHCPGVPYTRGGSSKTPTKKRRQQRAILARGTYRGSESQRCVNRERGPQSAARLAVMRTKGTHHFAHSPTQRTGREPAADSYLACR